MQTLLKPHLSAWTYLGLLVASCFAGWMLMEPGVVVGSWVSAGQRSGWIRPALI